MKSFYQSACDFVCALEKGLKSDHLRQRMFLRRGWWIGLGDFVPKGTIISQATSPFGRFQMTGISSVSDTVTITANTDTIGPITLGSTVIATASATVVSAAISAGFPAFTDGVTIVIYAPDLSYNNTAFVPVGSAGVTINQIDEEFNPGSEAVVEGDDECLTQDEGLLLLSKNDC